MSDRTRRILRIVDFAALAGLLFFVTLGGSARHWGAACAAVAIFLRITDYRDADRESLLKRVHYTCLGALTGMAVYLTLVFFGVLQVKILKPVAAVTLGLVMCALAVGVFATRRRK